jgi:L-alanine-DL-glutamate epimerase-like enolase superfamily enzyme
MLFKQIKQFGGHGRLAGGVCGVEMALWDLAGKAYGVPCYQLLGGKYRDQIRLYADTPKNDNPAEFAKVMKERVDRGFSFLKMDFGVEQVLNLPGAVVGAQPWGKLQQWEGTPGSYGQTLHPFTRVQITPKGIQAMADYVAQVRQAVGYDIPLASDHYGHFDVNTCIQLGRAVDPYRLAWLEDMVPWFYTDQWRQISDTLDTPTLTGEDIYLKEEFIKLINAKAVDMIHPDLASSGGLLETKKIGDYAEEHGIAMAMHMAGSPVCLLANVHCAAATQNFVCLEHHSVDLPWYDDLVTGPGKPFIQNGFVKVPEAPGLGIELNEKAIKEHLRAGTEYFGPTDQWNQRDSWDRTWG